MKRFFLTLVFVLVLVQFGFSAEPEKKVLIVRVGDTLSDIVWTLKMQGIEVSKLQEWNPGLGTQVQLGQEIVYYIPAVEPPVVNVQNVTNVKNVYVQLPAEKVEPAFKPEFSVSYVLALLPLICLWFFYRRLRKNRVKEASDLRRVYLRHQDQDYIIEVKVGEIKEGEEAPLLNPLTGFEEVQSQLIKSLKSALTQYRKWQDDPASASPAFREKGWGKKIDQMFKNGTLSVRKEA